MMPKYWHVVGRSTQFVISWTFNPWLFNSSRFITSWYDDSFTSGWRGVRE